MSRLFYSLCALFIALSTPAFAAPEKYTFDKNHTHILWLCDHLGFSESMGKFLDFDGNFTLDEAKPANSSVDVTIHIKSLLTGIPKFDEHLLSKDFFKVKEFPTAQFKSTSVELTGEKTAKVHGDFTMLGITKPLTLDVTLNKIGTNPMSNKKSAGFSATATIDRTLYGMDYGIPNVGKEVKLVIETEGSVDK